jgi:Ca2+-binding RTX toxin-like protein
MEEGIVMRPHRLHSFLESRYASELSAMRDALGQGHSRANSSGTSDHDHLVGAATRDALSGRAGPDAIAGMAGRDRLSGGSDNDTLWGGSGNDRLKGGSGDDLLVGGFGSDSMRAGTGNDTLLSRSDAGETPAAQGGVQVFDNEPFSASDDILQGGRGADTFRFELTLNGREEIVAKHVNDDGTIDWAGVTGENGAVHNHWVESIGDDVILDFNRDAGDTIQVAGHTVGMRDIIYGDRNGDGEDDYSIITLYSNQGAGAHNGDDLGTIKVYGDLVTADDVQLDAGVTYGAYDTLAEGPHMFEDDGVLVGGASNGGHHHEMT